MSYSSREELQSKSSWQDLFAQRLGLRFDGQPQLLGVAVRRLCDLTGLNETSLFNRMLETDLKDEIWQVVSDHVVVSSSRFFRDPEIYDAIETWMEALIRSNVSDLQMLSLGAADGRETFSLAMLTDDIVADCAINWRIWGIDISARAIQQAQRARYFRRQLDGVPSAYLDKYMFEDDNELWSPSDRLRRHVTFCHAFLDDCMTTMQPHLVICQNTLMYMTTEQQNYYLNWIEERLQPGGLVILSPIDVIWWRPNSLKPLANNKVRAFYKPRD